MNESTENTLIPELILSSFTNIEILNPKDFGIRKKVNIYTANNKEENPTIIFHIIQKSRFLQKDVDKIEDLNEIIINKMGVKQYKKAIIINPDLCSKAKNKLELEEWIILS